MHGILKWFFGMFGSGSLTAEVTLVVPPVLRSLEVPLVARSLEVPLVVRSLTVPDPGPDQ